MVVDQSTIMINKQQQQRSLWIVHDDDIKKKNDDDDTYEKLFQKFSNKPVMRPWSLIASSSLVVGQEFILSCFVLASHRVALSTTTSSLQSSSKHIRFEERFGVSLFLIWLTFLLVVWLNWSNQQPSDSLKRKNKLKYRTTDAIFMGILLRFLAAVLQTLTASYSSDTVDELAIATLFLHLLACDYSYANGYTRNNGTENKSNGHKNGSSSHANHQEAFNIQKRPTFQGGTMSLTAAFFATILLSSRIENNNLVVYIFVSSSVILFALYPAARHQVAANAKTFQQKTITTFVTTLMLGTATFLLLHPYEQFWAGIVLAILCGIVPIWTYYLQFNKRVLRGPWDIAHV